MTLSLCNFNILSATKTVTPLVACPTIEQTYFASLTTFPQSRERRHLVPPASGAPVTTVGTGYEFYVPQVTDFSSPTLDLQLTTLTASMTTAKALTVGATGLTTSGIVPATSMCSYIDFSVEPIAIETDPYLVYGISDLRIDLRVTTAAVAAVLDVIEPVPISSTLKFTPEMKGGLGAYTVRFYQPLRKVTTDASNLLQFRCSYPNFKSGLVPTATFRYRLTGTIGSTT